MRNNSLINDWLNDYKQQVMMQELAQEKEEQARRQGLFQIFNLMGERKAREAQMAQQAQQFAERLKLDQQEFAANERHRNALLQLQQQNLAQAASPTNNVNPDLYSKKFEERKATKEADRLSEKEEKIDKIDFAAMYNKINNARNALKIVDTGGKVNKLAKLYFENTPVNEDKAKAYSDIEVLSGKEWREAAESVKNGLSDKEGERVDKFVFGMGVNKKTNEELLNYMQKGLENLQRFQSFVDEYETVNGTTRGVEKAWRKYLNNSDTSKEMMNSENPEEKKNIMPNPMPGNAAPDKKNEEFLSGFGENMRQFGDALWQFPIDLYYGAVEGKEAPQLIPPEERNLAYTAGDIAGYLGGATGLMKGIGKAGLKNPLMQTILASAGIESAKDYEDRLGGGGKGALLGAAGYGIAKGAEKIIEPIASAGKKVLTKAGKKKELAALVEEEGKLAGDIYDKILGKYKSGENPSMNLVEGVQKEYKKVSDSFKEEYEKLFKAADDFGLKISNKDLPKSVQNIFEKYKSETAEKLSAKDLHEVLSKLKQQQRANIRTLERGDNVNVFKLEEEEKLLNKAIGDLQDFVKQKVPGYEQLSTRYKEEAVPYISTKSGRSIVKDEQDLPNFAKKLNMGQEEGMRDLYKVLPKKLQKTAAAGEFIKGQNIVEKDVKEVTKLYRDLMKKGSKNARENIESQIGKETGEQFNKLSKEIRNITEELQKLNAVKPNEDITKLVNYLSSGKVEKVTGIIERLLETPLGSGTINLLEKLQKALNQGEGRLLTSTLLSTSKPNREE